MVSYNTFVAMAIEGATETPYKETGQPDDPSDLTNYGASFGSATFFPLSGDESLEAVMNFADLPLPEMTLYHNKFQSFSRRAEGSLSLIVPPGLLGGGTDGSASGATTNSIKAWVYDRATNSYGISAPNQCRSATIWVCVGDIMKRFVGVKVGQGDFQINKSQPLIVNLNCMAYGAHLITPTTFTAPAFWTSAVYGGDFAAITVGDDSIDSGSVVNPVVTANVDNVQFSINNKLDDDPYRLWNSSHPRRMYNRDREVSGSFEADLFGSTEYARFLAGTLSSLEIDLGRTIASTTYTAGFILPRIRYDSHTGSNAGGQKDRIVKQNLAFKAMGGINGVNSDPREIRWD